MRSSARTRQHSTPKEFGTYYTPPHVVQSLVAWATAGATDAPVLDPACGDGRFLGGLSDAVGIDVDTTATATARSLTSAEIVTGDFFLWARSTPRRFAAVVGNPPFIRYQRFNGITRRRALRYCRERGVSLSALCSSWAPFVIGAVSLLKTGGRLALVIPAEIGHAVYSRPVLRYLLSSFARVEVIAIRQKLFPNLAEDCWLLRACGHGKSTNFLHFVRLDCFDPRDDSWQFEAVPLTELQSWNLRLRPFLLSAELRAVYRDAIASPETTRLGDAAHVGIGYVTGANNFFHLRPSTAQKLAVPEIGPVLAVSLKGTLNAIRNLTNRMEEAAGDCTNIHLAYPTLVYGFWHVIRANEEEDPSPRAPFPLHGDRYRTADLAILQGGRVSEGVRRYAHALERLSDREDLRDHPSRYEACGLTLVRCRGGPSKCGAYLDFPTRRQLDFNRMFRRLYDIYDRRFVYQAPAIKARTSRKLWERGSPVLHDTVFGGGAFVEMTPRTV